MKHSEYPFTTFYFDIFGEEVARRPNKNPTRAYMLACGHLKVGHYPDAFTFQVCDTVSAEIYFETKRKVDSNLLEDTYAVSAEVLDDPFRKKRRSLHALMEVK